MPLSGAKNPEFQIVEDLGTSGSVAESSERSDIFFRCSWIFGTGSDSLFSASPSCVCRFDTLHGKTASERSGVVMTSPPLRKVAYSHPCS